MEKLRAGAVRRPEQKISLAAYVARIDVNIFRLVWAAALAILEFKPS
jgi:hypothetical protein